MFQGEVLVVVGYYGGGRGKYRRRFLLRLGLLLWPLWRD